MILEIADIRIAPGKQAEFDEAIQRGLQTVIAGAKGFRGYKVNRGVESPERYILRVSRRDGQEMPGPIDPEELLVHHHRDNHPVEVAAQFLASRAIGLTGNEQLVRKGLRGPQVTLSRSHPVLVKKLFALEVPEIADGTVEIAAIAREAGHRTKIAVRSTVPGVNAKGACIGPMGQRVRNVMSELHGEKIDIVDWAEDPAELVAHALSPARVTSVEIVDLAARSCRVVVPDFQLSLAIGKEGQNARLAARLTGWRIDIRSDEAPAD